MRPAILSDDTDQDLARIDADAQRRARDTRSIVAGNACPLHLEGGEARPQRVILLRHGRAEQGHQPVAEQLAHRAAIGPDRFGQVVQRPAEIVAGFLGVGMLEQSRRVADVDEENADLLVFSQHL